MVNGHVEQERMAHGLAPAEEQPLNLELHHKMIELPYLPFHEEIADAARLIVVAILLGHHQHAMALLGNAHHILCGGHRIGQGLFAEHVQPGAEGGCGVAWWQGAGVQSMKPSASTFERASSSVVNCLSGGTPAISPAARRAPRLVSTRATCSKPVHSRAVYIHELPKPPTPACINRIFDSFLHPKNDRKREA